jgi:hypothetical protein
MTIFEFVGRFYFHNDVLKLQEDFLKLGIRVFLENGLGRFQAVCNYWSYPIGEK